MARARNAWEEDKAQLRCTLTGTEISSWENALAIRVELEDEALFWDKWGVSRLHLCSPDICPSNHSPLLSTCAQPIFS